MGWVNPWVGLDWVGSTERQSGPMSTIKSGGLNQHGAEPFEQQQFGTAGVEEVKVCRVQWRNQKFSTGGALISGFPSYPHNPLLIT